MYSVRFFEENDVSYIVFLSFNDANFVRYLNFAEVESFLTGHTNTLIFS